MAHAEPVPLASSQQYSVILSLGQWRLPVAHPLCQPQSPENNAWNLSKRRKMCHVTSFQNDRNLSVSPVSTSKSNQADPPSLSVSPLSNEYEPHGN